MMKLRIIYLFTMNISEILPNKNNQILDTYEKRVEDYVMFISIV